MTPSNEPCHCGHPDAAHYVVGWDAPYPRREQRKCFGCRVPCSETGTILTDAEYATIGLRAVQMQHGCAPPTAWDHIEAEDSL